MGEGVYNLNYWVKIVADVASLQQTWRSPIQVINVYNRFHQFTQDCCQLQTVDKPLTSTDIFFCKNNSTLNISKFRSV